MTCGRVRFGLTWAAAVLLGTSGNAGLYNPAERCPIPILADGNADPLSFGPQAEGTFPQLFSTLLNVADANPLRTQNPDRQVVLERIRIREKPLPRDAADVAGLAADYLRVGRSDEALNLLAPLSRSRTPDFRVLANLAHVHAVRGEWDEALRWHEAAFLDAEFPDDLAGATAPQRNWLKRVDREHYRRWLQVHRERTAAKLKPADEEVFPLFPVRWVNEAGVYEPGKLASAEKAKLPPDAVAVVQQLLLWSPGDTALYWLLAELYAAEGRLREAQYILDRCADTRTYSNRPVMMAHRAAVRDAVARLPKEPPPEDTPLTGPPPGPEQGFFDFVPVGRLVGVGVGGAVVVAVLVGLQVRSARRRKH